MATARSPLRPAARPKTTPQRRPRARTPSPAGAALFAPRQRKRPLPFLASTDVRPAGEAAAPLRRSPDMVRAAQVVDQLVKVAAAFEEAFEELDQVLRKAAARGRLDLDQEARRGLAQARARFRAARKAASA